MSGYTPDMGPWIAFTPTVTANTGTLTTVTASGFYKRLGKTIFFRMLVTFTNAGTGAGGNDISLPVTAVSNRQAASGAEVGATGKALACLFLDVNTMRVRFYDATYAGATGNQFQINGTYEAA
jgi:hypothetical protein